MVKLATKIEAVLYLKGQSLSLVDIAKYVNHEIEVVQDAIIELMSDYAYRDSALEVIETENGYSLQLRPVFNDLTDNISSNIKLFADDSSLFTRVNGINITHSRLVRDLETIKKWAYQWKMQFNPDISKQAIEVIFSHK